MNHGTDAFFTLLDHSGDIGVRVQAGTMAELFRQAACGFYAVLLEKPEDVTTEEQLEITLQEDDLSILLVNWLNELNFLFVAQGKLFREFELTLSEGRLQAKLRGCSCNPEQHCIRHEIKAVTFHLLDVEQTAGGQWRAQLILDL